MYLFKVFFIGCMSLLKGIVYFVKHFFIGLFYVLTIIPRYFIIGITYIFKRKDKNKISKENKKLSLAVATLSFCVYLVCVFVASRWYVQELKIKYLSKDIIDSTSIIEKEENNIDNNSENPSPNSTAPNQSDDTPTVYYPNDYWDYLSVPFMDVNFDDLLKKNPDTVGWIKVEGTKVNYPVVQTNDNDYYLSHAFNKRVNAGGWIYADYRVNFKDFGKNTIIYGHNLNNKTMFGSIPSMLYSGYLNSSNDKYIKVSTPTSNSVWKVFSVYSIAPEVYYLKTNFKSESYKDFLNNLKNRSIYDFNVDVTENDKILTLSTCDDTGTKKGCSSCQND